MERCCSPQTSLYLAAVRDFFVASTWQERQLSARALADMFAAWPESKTIASFTEHDWLENEYAFMRIFVGPGPVLAPPYASVYIDEDSLLMGESTLQVRFLLHSLGLRVPHEGRDPDDFLAYELDAWLMLEQSKDTAPQPPAEVAVSTIATDLSEARHWFLHDHLRHWLPLFLHRARQHSTEAPAILLVIRVLGHWLASQTKYENSY